MESLDSLSVSEPRTDICAHRHLRKLERESPNASWDKTHEGLSHVYYINASPAGRLHAC